MARRIRVTPEGEADINEAFVWYERARSGLGERFVNALQQTLLHVAEHPTANRLVHDDIRRALVRPFPFAVFYVHDDVDVTVIGCFHARRDPTIWGIRGRRYDKR